jgi:hypothetical protein
LVRLPQLGRMLTSSCQSSHSMAPTLVAGDLSASAPDERLGLQDARLEVGVVLGRWPPTQAGSWQCWIRWNWAHSLINRKIVEIHRSNCMSTIRSVNRSAGWSRVTTWCKITSCSRFPYHFFSLGLKIF